MSTNPLPPSASAPSYQIGAGAPVNQQYLNPQSEPQPPEKPPRPNSLGGPRQQQPCNPPDPSNHQHPSGHPGLAPPPYVRGAPDIPPESGESHVQGAGQYMMSGGAGPAPGLEQQQQYYPPPTQQHGNHSQSRTQGAGQQVDPPPPPSQHTMSGGAGPGLIQGHEQEQQQQQYPPPPQYADEKSHGRHQAQQHNLPQSLQQTTTSIDQPSHQTYPPPPQYIPDGHHDAMPPPQPPRPDQQISGQSPRRHSAQFSNDDPSNPIHYTRDPHKLVAYLVPFPKPQIKGIDPSSIPDRFLIYTPPPPPLSAPKEGEKEDKLHKVQRRWQEEVRAAKNSDAKTASWKGVKSKATRGISYVMSKTTTSNLDFVNRIPSTKAPATKDTHADDGVHEDSTTHKTIGLEEMILVYPSSHTSTSDQVKTEFINTMLRTKSKAQRDAIIATGLLPVSAAIDIMATLIWPFGGLLEVDGVWAYSSIRGAKTARSVTKRLSSSTRSPTSHHQTEEQEMAGNKLRLNFTQSPRLGVLTRYLVTRCRDYDHKLFPTTEVPPTETEVLAAIGWAPSQNGGVGRNWEDEAWEGQEVREDVRATMGKAAREWGKWCEVYAKKPEKAVRK